MKHFYNLLIIIVVFISIAAGLSKVLQAPQEVEFLQQFGLTSLHIIVFGIIQVLGGVFLAIIKTRLHGGVIVIFGFISSSILIFISGNIVFGMISLLPVFVTSVIIHRTVKPQLKQN